MPAPVDLSQRFGARQRLRPARERRRRAPRPAGARRRGPPPPARRWPATGALGPDTLLEAEFETSHRSQPSVPGFSLLGDRVPAPGRPAHQPEQPALVAAGGARRQHRLAALARSSSAADWRFTAHARDAAPAQRRPHRLPVRLLRRRPTSTYYARPLLPRRQLRPLRLPQRERAPPHRRARPVAAGHAAHRRRRARADASACCEHACADRFQRQAFNFAGTGNIDGTRRRRRPRPTLTDENTNRDERRTELYLRDAITLDRARQPVARPAPHAPAPRERAHRRHRAPTDYAQSFTHTVAGRELRARAGADWSTPAGASGVESEVAPNRARYTNAGAGAAGAEEPAGRGRPQGQRRRTPSGGVALFDIRRPLVRRHRRLRRRRHLHARRPTASSATAASRPAGAAQLARGPCAAARSGCARGAKAAEPGASNGKRADQRAGAHAQAAGRLPRRRAARPDAAGGAGRTRAAAWCCPTTASRIPRLDAPGPRRALRARASAARNADLARRRRQRDRPPRLAGIALPVRPRLPVPAGAAHLARCRSRPTCEPARNAGYNARLIPR